MFVCSFCGGAFFVEWFSLTEMLIPRSQNMSKVNVLSLIGVNQWSYWSLGGALFMSWKCNSPRNDADAFIARFWSCLIIGLLKETARRRVIRMHDDLNIFMVCTDKVVNTYSWRVSMGTSQPFCKKSSVFVHVMNRFLDQACSIKMTGYQPPH